MPKPVVRYTHARVARVVIRRRAKDKQYEYLLVMSSKRNEWEFAGGKVKSGENHLEAAIREVREETGLRLISAERYAVIQHDIISIDGTLTTRTVKRYFVAKRIERWSQLAPQPPETTAVAWFTAEAALALAHENGQPQIKHETRVVLEELEKKWKEPLTIKHTTSFQM